MKSRIAAWRVGFVDGWRSPRELSHGKTYGDARDTAYDRGVNTGQFCRSPRHAERRSS